ncbi:MAPEG family protein [Reyranella sp. CPCC 100927]|uniref:MAPEG family protein n=1 Tax=Reyranella sp. CPCC 100927 TaxID=2599616 RepID=UPI0011B62A72|nr:MAPEG family protein [Reyranella sp. CPCC 100927]TWT02822.1 glutathione S-transferase [Reyranella sp. CPCC 100927]
MPTTLPLITAFWAGLIGLLGVVLSINVVRLRRKLDVGLGDGGHEELIRATRVFGNFAEYTAICLIMIALLDMLAGPRWLIHLCGAALLLGRLVHAWGITGSRGVSTGRVVGMVATWAVMLVTGITLIWTARGAVL